MTHPPPHISSRKIKSKTPLKKSKSVTQPQKTFFPNKNNLYRHPMWTNTIDKSIL